jgi:hypothetical protein
MDNSTHIVLGEDSLVEIKLAIDVFRKVKLKNNINIIREDEETIDYFFGRNKFSYRTTFPLKNSIPIKLKTPRINGFEALNQIKNANLPKRIPWIIFK